MPLLTLDQAIDLSMEQANRYYADHINKGLLQIFRILGTDDLDVVSAQGCTLILSDGRSILDFTSSIGVLGLGHNHPRILAAERRCHDHYLVDALKVGPMKLQAALAYNIAQLLPGPLEVCSFAVSGAEAVEAAMKCAEKAQGTAKRSFITTSGAYHGKTHGALALTRTEGFAEGFLLGVPPDNVIEVTYGSTAALEEAISQRRGTRDEHDIIAAVVEPVQGQSLAVAPEGYLEGVVDVCRRNGILTIFDEVKVGMYRTGAFCAFQSTNAVPDFVTISKALGGGKRAIAAMVTSQALFDKAYGQRRKDAGLHTTTFGGLGESCAVAIEALNVMSDPEFVAASLDRASYLRERLESLHAKHPNQIVEIRGAGLLLGVRFSFSQALISQLADKYLSGLFSTYQSVIMASLIGELYRKHAILAHFAASDPDVLHVMPPLIVEESNIDRFIEALDTILSEGLSRVVARFISRNIQSRIAGG